MLFTVYRLQLLSLSVTVGLKPRYASAFAYEDTDLFFLTRDKFEHTLSKSLRRTNNEQKEFLKEFKDLLLKYDAYIGWTCDDCSDTYGLYNDHLYISMLGQKDIDLYDNSIDYNDLDELYKKAEIEIKKKN